MVEIQMKGLDFFKERKKKKCEFCGGSFGNVVYHKYYCELNPDKRRAEQCPHCGKYFKRLFSHLSRCKWLPAPIEKVTVETVYISPDLLIKLRGNEPNFSRLIRKAIREKIERDKHLPDLQKNIHTSVSLNVSLHKDMKKIIKKGWDGTKSGFIRQAIIEAVKNMEEGDG